MANGRVMLCGMYIQVLLTCCMLG